MLIRSEEMKNIIEKYPLIEAARDSLKLSCEQLAGDIDGAIYSAYMGGHGEGSPSGSTSDKTGNIAASLGKRVTGDLTQIQRDVGTLSRLIESLNNGFKSLTVMQRLITDLHYMSGGKKTWKEVVGELRVQNIYFSERHVKRIHEYAITRMIAASQIHVDTYKEVMEIMEGRGI